MRNRWFGKAWVALAILGRALAQEAPPTAASLIAKAAALEKAQNDKDWKFTFREDEDKLPVDKKGNQLTPSHRTYDNIMLEGDLYRKLILIDGKPPEPKLQKNIEAEMERERAVRRTRSGTGRHEVNVGSLEQIARMCDSKVTGQEAVSGRMAWRVESQPKSDYKPAGKEEAKFLGARRVTWFDRQEGVALKYLEVFILPTAGFQPGSEIEREFAKHDDAWLMDRLVLRYNFKMMAVVRGRGETRLRFYDFKKFTAESRIVE
jgi:hypothetical protein